MGVTRLPSGAWDRGQIEALLSLLAEHSRESVFIRDAATGDLIYVSQAAGRMVGIPEAELPETREGFLELVHPEDRPVVMALYQQARDGPTSAEFRVARSDGAMRWVVVRALPLRQNGAVTAIAGIGEDVTERRAEAEAERRTQGELVRVAGRSAMWEIASALGHEIHQPLFAIRTLASACARRIESGTASMPYLREACEKIAGEVDRSTALVRRLCDMAGARPPVTRPEDLNAIVAETLRMAGPEVLPPDVTVLSAPDRRAPVVRADRVEVQLVILNLVRNAVEAMTDRAGPRRLWITVGSDGLQATVSVRDSGGGFPPEHADRMFDPFFTTKEAGTGMGLAICRTAIDAHGGRMEAENHPDGGAVFTFTLPLAAAEAHA